MAGERTDVGTVEDMHASATKLVGLDDFGVDDDNYREALGVLLDSYRSDAGLTPLGSKMNRFFLRGALVSIVALLIVLGLLLSAPIMRAIGAQGSQPAVVDQPQPGPAAAAARAD